LFPNPKQKLGSKKQEKPTKEIALSEIRDELSKYLRLAEKEQIVITRLSPPGVNNQSLKLADERRR